MTAEADQLLSVGWPVFLAIGTETPGGSQATAVGMLGSSNQLVVRPECH